MRIQNAVERNQLSRIILFLVIMLLGVVYVRYTYFRFENEKINNVQNAISIEAALPKEDIKALEAKPDDSIKPQYQVIKNTLIEIIRANPKARFAYIYTEQNGKIFFIADSEPEDSPDYSPPGQEYTEAKYEDKQPFRDGKAIITSPLSDRWGTWVSALVPIKDQATGRIIAVFGVDFNADSWNSFLVFEVIESMFLIVLLLMAVFFSLKTKAQNELFRFDISERKQSEEALRESEARFRNLADTAPVLIWMSGTDTLCTYVNKPWLDFTGCSLEQAVGKGWEKGIHPADYQDCIDIYLGANKSQSEYKLEYRLRHSDGEYRWLLEKGVPRFTPEGIYVGFIGSCVDITERKCAEEALQNILALMDATFESMHNGILVVNHGGKVIKFNTKFAEMWRIPGEILDSRDDNVLLGFVLDKLSDPENFISKVNELYKTPEAESLDLIYFNDGRIFERLSKPMYIKGEPEGRVWSFLDITERRQVEEALRGSEEKFRNLVEATNDVIWETNAEGLYTYVSPQIEDILGYKQDEFIGYSPFRFMPPEESEKIKKRSDEIIASKESFTGLINTNLHKNGHRTIFETNGVPILDSNDNLIGYRGIDRDITEREKAETEIRMLNAELEERVKQRTLQLENVNKELEAFSYSVAHNLRSPLRGIDGWGMALLEDYDGILDDKGRTYLKRMRSEAQQMGNLIDDLLKLPRVTLFELNLVDVDLSAIVQSITGQLTLAYKERHYEFKIEQGITVEGDLSMLQIALTNLLDNASKFTGSKPIACIEFGKLMVDDKPAFFIRDNGVGFNMDYAKNLFSAFHRMHKQMEFPGVGIGLATVHRIITRHGGQIWAESKPNEGATFYFTFN